MSYRDMYEIEVRHSGLNKYRHIRGTDRYVVEQKAQAQKAIWEEMWQKKIAAEKKKHEKEKLLKDHESKKQSAIEQTAEALKTIESLQSILHYTLDIDDTINWESLIDKSEFKKLKPNKPNLKKIPNEPLKTDPKFIPSFNIFDKIFPSRKEKKIEISEQKFINAHKSYIGIKNKIEKENADLIADYNNKVKQWEEEKEQYYIKQKEANIHIDNKKKQYFEKNPDSIYEYCDMVLTNSKYPDFFTKEYDFDYNPENKILVVDYSLPSLDCVPTLKEVKYISSKDEFSETHLSESALNMLYDDLLYQIVLRSIHELYEADVVDALESIVFNGWVESIDKATGKNINACIMTVQANKKDFMEINLKFVDPKICFKNLKGVGSSKLHSLTPVAPILKINKEDRRFIDSYDVSGELYETYNLAAMDWEDFEHLIREVFEKEFSTGGGEVKVTQASRDGGVDAIAFDPDPIRGGKIVIQAKRYTNVVGVSAVRDLYGTVMNEGAIKGILITTADYGPDAYDFASGKPLTLLNGSNLLHLLGKHGTKAKIDLKEAKKIIAEQENK